MNGSSALLQGRLVPWLHALRRRRTAAPPKPVSRIEPLEARIAPATFAGAGGPSLDITLDHAGEAITIAATATTYTVASNFNSTDGGQTGGHVSGLGTMSAAIDSAAFTTIHITDSATGTSVTFGASGANVYTSAFNIVLDDPTAGDLTFAGASNFAGGLKASVNGNITQTAPVTAQTVAGVSLTSTAGAITLNDAGNNFSIISLATSVGTNAISLHNSGGLTLDHVTTGNGNLTISAGSGIGQTSTGRIDVGGNTIFDVTAGASVTMSLNQADNFFAGDVTFTESGGDIGSIQLRNISPTATLPNLSDLPAGDLSDLQLTFDGTGIAFNAATAIPVAASANLALTAGGPITQSAPIIAATLTATVLGNHGITLTDGGNLLTGAVSLNNPAADGGAASAVSYVESNAVNLTTSHLGLGTLSVTALTGSITESGAITQPFGAGAASFTATAGTTIDLSLSPNTFAGPVHFLGAAVTTVKLRDANTLAALPDLTNVTDTLTDLTLTFNNAPVVLPNYTLTNLTVAADGIYQAPDTALHISGTSDLNSNNFAINLPNTDNDFGTLRLRSSGHEDVSVLDKNAVIFGAGNSDLGTGRLHVVAPGGITQSGFRIKQAAGAGPAYFEAGVQITLDRPANDFTGEVLLNTPGSATVVDTNSVILGQVNVALGLSVTATNSITQLPGSTISAAGTTTLSGGGANVITLDNPGNLFTGAIQLTGGNVTLRNTGAVTFTGTSTVAALNITAGGAITELAGSSLVVSGTSSFDAGTALIDLGLAGNNFTGAVAVTSTAAVTLGDLNGILLGNVRLGGGAFAVNAAGNITQATGTSITQTATGALSFLGGATNNVTLNQAGNNFLGTIAVDAKAVSIATLGDLTFTGTSDIDDNFTVTAGGTLRLPTTAANLNDLGIVTLSAANTIVSTNLATDTGTGITFHGAVQLASGISINTSTTNGMVTFDGDVNPLGSLSFNVGNQSVIFSNGTWNQGTNNLTITTTGTTAFDIGGVAALPTTFAMSGGTIGLTVATGGHALEVFPGSTFHVGSTAGTPEVATINIGAVPTTLQFDSGSALRVGFGATNDRLAVTGLGSVLLGDVRLLGSGVAGAPPSPVLDVTGGGILTGTFTDSVALDGSPQPFLARSDIVTAGYLPGSALIGSGGPAPAASFSGFLPDGDKYTVTHSGGVAAGLVVIQNAHGQIDVAVRNNAAAGTLNIVTTKFSGDGLTEVGGIGISGAGAIAILAATSDLNEDLWVENALTSLTIHDVLNDATTTQPQLIHAGGAASTSTSITGHLFDGVGIEIGGALSTFKAAAFISTNSITEPAHITAEHFGTLSVVGDAADDLAGLFHGRLSNRNTLGAAIALANFTGADLGGTWDLAGSVGTVTATHSTAGWVLGASGPGTMNFHGVTSTGNLSLADVSSSSIFATGAVAAFKASHVLTVNISASTLGAFSAVANPAAFNQFGDVNALTLTLSSNKAGVALPSLSVAASLSNSTLHFLDGNVGTITVGRELGSSFLIADATTAGGRFNAITVGRWNNTDLDAKSVGTLKSTGNAIAGEFGDIVDSNFTIRGNMAGLGIGTLSASGAIDTDVVVLRNGGMTSLTAGRNLVDSSVTLFDAALGNVKTVTAGRWDTTDLTARTIGTLKVTGAAQVAPASPLLVGDLVNSALLAFVENVTTPAIGSLTVAGGLGSTTVTAHNGITTVTVGRSFASSTVVADNALTGQLPVGRIGAFTVGQWTSSQVVATTLGKVSTTGFITQEGTVPAQFTGLFSGGTLLAKGASTAGTKSGLDSLSVAGNLIGTPAIPATVTARSGLGSLTVRGVLQGTTLTFDDPLNVGGSGKVIKVSAGTWLNSTIRANVLTTLQTVPSAIDAALGDFTNPTVTFAEVTVAGSSGAATDPVALTTFTVAHDVSDTTFNIPAGVKTFKVGGTVSNSDLAAGFGANARLASVTAGAWDNTDLTTRVLSAMNVTGNTPRAIAGNITDSLLTIMGNNAGVGLGTVLAQGTVSNTTFQVTDGNVTSFIAGKFLDSNLLAGFRATSSLDLTQGGVFGATARTIALFKTTQAFDPTDPDSVSFHDSTVVAANLGAITLTGVDTATDRPIIFGLGFKTGDTAGVVKADVGAGLVTQTAPFTSGDFTYKGL